MRRLISWGGISCSSNCSCPPLLLLVYYVGLLFSTAATAAVTDISVIDCQIINWYSNCPLRERGEAAFVIFWLASNFIIKTGWLIKLTDQFEKWCFPLWWCTRKKEYKKIDLKEQLTLNKKKQKSCSVQRLWLRLSNFLCSVFSFLVWQCVCVCCLLLKLSTDWQFFLLFFFLFNFFCCCYFGSLVDWLQWWATKHGWKVCDDGKRRLNR